MKFGTDIDTGEYGKWFYKVFCHPLPYYTMTLLGMY